MKPYAYAYGHGITRCDAPVCSTLFYVWEKRGESSTVNRCVNVCVVSVCAMLCCCVRCTHFTISTVAESERRNAKAATSSSAAASQRRLCFIFMRVFAAHGPAILMLCSMMLLCCWGWWWWWWCRVFLLLLLTMMAPRLACGALRLMVFAQFYVCLLCVLAGWLTDCFMLLPQFV